MSANELWLRLPRDRMTERGYGVTHKPGDVARKLSGTFEIDPVTGFACCPVDFSMTDPSGWDGLGEDFLESEPFLGEGDVYTTAWSHRDPMATFALTATTLLPDGAGLFFGFVAYDGGNGFELRRGPYRLTFTPGGKLDLYGPGSSAVAGAEPVPLASVQMWDEEEWANQDHFLYVYAAGRWVIARRLGPSPRYLSYLAPAPDDGGAVLPADFARLYGLGYLTFALCPERHGQVLDFTFERTKLPEPSTTGAIGLCHSIPASGGMLGGPSIEVTTFSDDGTEIAGDEDPPLAASAFSYNVTALLAEETGGNLYVTRCRVKFPKKVDNDELVGVDLLGDGHPALPAIGIRAPWVEERRGLDPASCGLTFATVSDRGALAPYVQPNMMGQWKPGGVQRAEFFTSRPQLTPHVGREELPIECELGWKRFKEAKWPGEFTVAGMLLSDAYRAVAKVAGLSDAQMVIAAGTDYQLPRERADGEPLFDFRPGQTIAEILCYLRDHFSLRDILRFTPDGLFHADPRPQAASGTVFYLTAADPADPLGLRNALLGLTDRPYIRRDSWHERYDEVGFANEVEVVGMADDGRPLVAVATDWPSIRDPYTNVGTEEEPVLVPTFNYVAEFRRMVILDAGLTTQGLVDWVCEKTLARVRLLKLVAECRGSYVQELLEGDIVEVDTRGLWRVTGMKTRWDREFPGGLSSYELEAWDPAQETLP
ncbi:MAG: hypothetical protein HYU66_25570 [Armatimonadetes bacterium]|nr:hypothetical protein [Armatimonadota bacterium]